MLNNEDDFHIAFKGGATGVMTDYPTKLKTFLSENPQYLRNFPNLDDTSSLKSHNNSMSCYNQLNPLSAGNEGEERSSGSRDGLKQLNQIQSVVVDAEQQLQLQKPSTLASATAVTTKVGAFTPSVLVVTDGDSIINSRDDGDDAMIKNQRCNNDSSTATASTAYQQSSTTASITSSGSSVASAMASSTPSSAAANQLKYIQPLSS